MATIYDGQDLSYDAAEQADQPHLTIAQERVLASVPKFGAATVLEVRDHLRSPRTDAARRTTQAALDSLAALGLVTRSTTGGALPAYTRA